MTSGCSDEKNEVAQALDYLGFKEILCRETLSNGNILPLEL